MFALFPCDTHCLPITKRLQSAPLPFEAGAAHLGKPDATSQWRVVLPVTMLSPTPTSEADVPALQGSNNAGLESCHSRPLSTTPSALRKL